MSRVIMSYLNQLFRSRRRKKTHTYVKTGRTRRKNSYRLQFALWFIFFQCYFNLSFLSDVCDPIPKSSFILNELMFELRFNIWAYIRLFIGYLLIQPNSTDLATDCTSPISILYYIILSALNKWRTDEYWSYREINVYINL